MDDQPKPDFSAIAESAKLRGITEMALDFTAMTQKLTKGSVVGIRTELQNFFAELEKVPDQATYDRLHTKFWVWFTQNVQIAERTVGKKVKRTIPAHPASFGHAAKVLDIAAKVYVYYCSLPSPDRARSLVPLLHGGLDNQLIRDLIERFPDMRVTSENLEDVDSVKYARLQTLVHIRIREDFQSSIQPVQYDDILFRKLNRPAEAEFQLLLGGQKVPQSVKTTKIVLVC